VNDVKGTAGEKNHEAMFYEKLPDSDVQCLLCPRKCIIGNGKRGSCRTRENREGILYSMVYAKPCAVSVEPVEKAPFYHFIPGHIRLCLATAGCNLMCAYCQNWHISQRTVEETEYHLLPPQEAVQLAVSKRATSICFTFTEPVVCYEYMYDVAREAKQRGLLTSMVSNGYINQEPLRRLLNVLDAVKIDLKAFAADFYPRISSGELEPVLRTLRIIKEEEVWLEIVNLVVPTLNDDPEGIQDMCSWILITLGDSVPLHFTRFFPMYRLTNIPATPVQALETAHSLARETGLKYVYIGNVPGHAMNSTYCACCGDMLIQRIQFEMLQNKISNGSCPSCGNPIPGCGL
jgi:pyruvate formate lyase activating enzyme